MFIDGSFVGEAVGRTDACSIVISPRHQEPWRRSYRVPRENAGRADKKHQEKAKTKMKWRLHVTSGYRAI